MIWENSSILWLVLLLPVIYAGYWWYSKAQIKKREKLFDDRLLKDLRKGYWETGDKVRLFSMLLAALFFIVALAGPKFGTEVREIQRTGLNILVALDLSKSMNAEDVRPSRLDKAKFEVNRLVSRLQGDRIGLVVFTDEAFIQAPLTTDYSAMRLFLDIANTDQMPTSGTNFTSALNKSAEAFDSIEREPGITNVLLFIADGEHHGPDFSTALNQLTDRGVLIYTVGIGTLDGGPIPVYDPSGRLVRYHRDASGNTVTTRLEQTTLREIASAGNGEYFEIRSGSDNIEPFFSRLDDLERGEFASQEYADYENQYQALLLIGVILLLTGLFFPDSIKSESPNGNNAKNSELS